MKNVLLKSILLVFTIFILSCSNSTMRGEYLAQDFSVINKFTFLSGGKVEISNMMKTSIGKYKLEGNKVTITANGDTIIFTVSNDYNCLDSGGMLGVYCKK